MSSGKRPDSARQRERRWARQEDNLNLQTGGMRRKASDFPKDSKGWTW